MNQHVIFLPDDHSCVCAQSGTKDGIDAFLCFFLFAVKQTVWICPHVPFNRNLLCMSLLTLYSVDNTALPEYIMNLSDLTWVTSFHTQSYIL